jgi:predicted Zn finger-like uncharacterized protein
MRINCPSCKAGYEVPDALLGAAARRVRCARCAHEWTPEAPAAVMPDAVVPDAVVPDAVAPEAPAPLEEPRLEPAPFVARLISTPRVDSEPPPSLRGPPTRSPILASAAVIALSVVALVALGWAAYLWRAEVMLIWPPSQRLFAALGLH